MKVKELEEALYKAFPKSDAEDWDNPGLSVGEAMCDVQGIFCALDVTFDAINECVRKKCNVLLTHHPVCLDFPKHLVNGRSYAEDLIFYAMKMNINLIAMHTNLDRNRLSTSLCATFGLDYIADKIAGLKNVSEGYGLIHSCGMKGVTIDDLSRTLRARFHISPTVWSKNPGNELGLIGIFPGSIGSMGFDAYKQGVKTLIVGEINYHHALELYDLGMNVVEIGHDVSEFMFVGLLKKVAAEIVPSVPVVLMNESARWKVYSE